MNAVVVYESLWGNTAAVARAIAEGMGPDVPALATDQATAERLAAADLIVAGAPVLGFSLPSEQMRESVRGSAPGAPAPADLSHPSMRSWLDSLPLASGAFAAFETRVRGPVPGGSVKHIAKGLEAAGRREIAKASSFYVAGKYGPLRDGELDRARAWGAELAKAQA